MSNTERQRQFRERNPGYYRRLHARRRAAGQALAEARRLAAEAEQLQQATRRQPLALPAPPLRLALPAPAETIEIPGMTTIPTLDALRAREPMPAPAATPPAAAAVKPLAA